MKTRKNKKGFTIVELVIVVGVIGILSAILIPTFTNLTNQARANANKSEAQYAYEAYLISAEGDANASEVLNQTQVAIKNGDKWFVYGSEGWNEVSSADAKASVAYTYQGGIEVHELN